MWECDASSREIFPHFQDEASETVCKTRVSNKKQKKLFISGRRLLEGKKDRSTLRQTVFRDAASCWREEQYRPLDTSRHDSAYTDKQINDYENIFKTQGLSAHVFVLDLCLKGLESLPGMMDEGPACDGGRALKLGGGSERRSWGGAGDWGMGWRWGVGESRV